MAELKIVQCPISDCGFRIQGNDEREITDVVKMHMKNKHDKTVKDSDVKTMIR